MKILVDAFGGDGGANVMLSACINAINKFDNIEIEILGQIDILEKLLEQNQTKFDRSRLTLVDAPEIISCHEAPIEAIRTKRQSSLVIGLNKLKTGEYAGLVSAGSTGAVLGGAVLKLGKLPGVSRPALSPLLPTITGGKVLLLDSGANMDCKPINLCHFALMGSQYMSVMENIETPRVAVLNVGTEDEKGNELVKTAIPMLKNLPINFVGSMEARDALSGNYDVIVADGFAGNVLLKSIEGTLKAFMKVLKEGLMSSTAGKIGGLIIKKPLKTILKRYDYQSYGGSPMIGTKQIVVKAHGSAKVDSVVSAIEQVKDFAEKDLLNKLADAVKDVEIIEESAE